MGLLGLDEERQPSAFIRTASGGDPFDPLLPDTETQITLPLELIQDIIAALESSLEDHQELASIISSVGDGNNQGLRPSQRREIEHHEQAVVKVQRLLDKLAGSSAR
jgi:hypothetical protein